MQCLASIAVLAPLMLAAGPAPADGWPPPDPGEGVAKVSFTTAFAQGLRAARSLAALQEAAGARGRIVAVIGAGDAPHLVYEWKGAGGSGTMTAFVYRTGDFGVTIALSGRSEPIVLNNFGAFVCAVCSPPVNACGHRPSWVPHDLHWDTFDCRCTLTGPQSLHAGVC